MRPAVTAGLSAAALVGTVFFLFADPIFSFVATMAAGEPVRFTGVRLRGNGDFSVAAACVGPPVSPRATAEGVRLRRVFAFLFGGTLRVRFGRAESEMGHARGGLLWKAGRLIKAHARVTLSPRGLSRVPSAWIRRLLRTSDGPAFFAAYAAGRVVLRGKAGPILEAAWQPA